MSKRIVILNDGSGPNQGDQAILWAMLTALKSSFPDAEISVLPYRWMLKNLLREIDQLRQSDLAILGGGQVLHDQTSASFALLVLSRVALARALKKRVMGYAIGVGPLKRRFAKWAAKRIFNQFEVITVREFASQKGLEELGVTKPPITVTADASFLLEAARLERVKEIFAQEGLAHFDPPLVAIAPRRWFHYHHSLIPVKYKARFLGLLKGQREFKNLEKTIAKIADQLIIEKGASILFTPMRRSIGRVDPGQDDEQVSSEIIGLMKHKKNVTVLSRDYNPEELKGVLGQMDLIIGMRMHSLIMGGSMGVPVIGIGITPKFDAFFKMMGQEFFLIDPNNLEGVLTDKIHAALSHRAIIRKELLSRAEHLRTRAWANNDFASKLLGN